VICHPPERDLIVAGVTQLVAPGERNYHQDESVTCNCGFGGFHDDINPRCDRNVPAFVAPQRWVDATGPCPKCEVVPDRWCPDCIDGRKREALQVEVRGVRWSGVTPVTFAYATVEVLPVLTYNSSEWATHVMVDLPADYVDECTSNEFVPENARGVFVRRHKIDGTGKVYWSEELFGVDPLPVPGRDWVVLLDNVELT
jgi:hypothetical protein